MRCYGGVEASRLLIEWEIDRTDGSITHPTKIPNPVDPSHPTLARKAYQLAKLVIRLTQQAVKAHHDQIQADLKADGRVVDISSPVQLSNGIVETIKLIESGEPALQEFEETILSLGERASFDGYPSYERLSKASLNLVDKIVPRTQLFLHTYLWIQWTTESLRQANQFAEQITDEHKYDDISESAFPYIAHPPLIVATIACTTMIEEVGTAYINSFADGKHHNPEETSVSDVLDDIIEEYTDSTEFEFAAIDNYVIESRNEVAHYIRRRKNVVSIADFEDFRQAVMEGVRLVNELLTELIDRPLSEFMKALDQHLSMR